VNEELEPLFLKLARAFRLTLRKTDVDTAQMYAKALGRMPAPDEVIELAIERYEKMPTIAALNRLATEIGGDQVLRVDQYVPIIRREAGDYASFRRRVDAPSYTPGQALDDIEAAAEDVVADLDTMHLSDDDIAVAFSRRAHAAAIVRERDAAG
jgi:hypothetical protein